MENERNLDMQYPNTSSNLKLWKLHVKCTWHLLTPADISSHANVGLHLKQWKMTVTWTCYPLAQVPFEAMKNDRNMDMLSTNTGSHLKQW